MINLARSAMAGLLVVLSLSLVPGIQAQSTAMVPTTPYTTTITTSLASISQSRSGTTVVPVTTFLPTTFVSTVTPTRSSSQSSSGSSVSQSSSSTVPSESTSATPVPITLDTKLDPAFGVLGGLLIITGLPSAFLGHKNRWTSFFLVGFYTLSLSCAVLIIRFGVEQANHPPSKSLRGMFVLASTVAGVIGGGFAVFFWKGTRYFIGAWGGFAFALWIECFRNGGLIDPIGFRYILFIGCAVIGFTLCTISRIHYYVVIISTAFIGATSTILGVDCFTTANLKEFYVWNLGFSSIFPKFTTNYIRFPVSQSMEIELGLIGAVTIMGIAVQLRVLKILQRKLHEIKVENRRLEEIEEARVTNRFDEMGIEREQWEKDHPGMPTHVRNQSGLSSMMPLMKDQEALGSPSTPGNGTPSTFAMDGRKRTQSAISDYMLDGRRSQSPGAIPALDLGLGIQDDVPESYLADGKQSKLAPTTANELEDLAKKEALLSEIQTIRRSIQGLKEEPGAASGSRRPSLSSRRTLSNDLTSLAASNHLRTTSGGTRSRAHSMNLDNLTQPQPAARPTSVPMQEDWDHYVRDRKLMQPPSGVTPPISPTPRAAVSPAVLDALADRHRRERSVELGTQAPIRLPTPTLSALEVRHGQSKSTLSGSEDIPLATFMKKHERSQSSTSRTPVTILPPAKTRGPQTQTQNSPRTRTYEELIDRHQAKIRELQGPLSSAERERAQLEQAKERWNRSKELERDAVTRRQAEKAAAVAKVSDPRKSSEGLQNARPRTLSADKLAALPAQNTSSRRQSVLKVEDWQAQRMSTVPAQAQETSRQQSSSRTVANATAPFPPDAHARRMSNPLRDPIN